jgi:hypothetical protein
MPHLREHLRSKSKDLAKATDNLWWHLAIIHKRQNNLDSFTQNDNVHVKAIESGICRLLFLATSQEKTNSPDRFYQSFSLFILSVDACDYDYGKEKCLMDLYMVKNKNYLLALRKNFLELLVY